MKFTFHCRFVIAYGLITVSIWSNANVFVCWHESIDVGGPVQVIHRPQNDVRRIGNNNSSAVPLQSIDFLGGLQQLKDIISQIKVGRRIRAYGSKWSMNNILYLNDTLIETWGLNYYKIGIDDPKYVATNYQTKSNHLVFVQSGVTVKHLNTVLEAAGLSLITAGTSDGQRLVGAISTGTHGSAPYYGTMTEFVRGIHIVISGTEHFFIQRESDPTVTLAFANEFLNGATLMESNDLFDAALVGLGSFGIIHAMLIEVEPLYVLRTQYSKVNYNDIKNDIASMDVSSFGLKGFDEVPYYIKFVLNPYNLKKTFINVAEKIPIETESALTSYLQKSKSNDKDFFIEDPIVTILGTISKKFTWLQFLNNNLKGIFRPMRDALRRFAYSQILDIVTIIYMRNWAKADMQTSGAIFQAGEENPRPYTSTGFEIAVPVERVTEVVDICLEILQRRLSVQQIVVRYTKGSSATLASAPFAMTAFVDMYGIWNNGFFDDTEDIYNEIFEAVAASAIPHCYHFGKKLPPTSNWIVDSCYGMERRDAWIKQRELFLVDPATRNKFSSDTLEMLGLHS